MSTLRRHPRPGPCSFQMSGPALDAIERLRLALNLSKKMVLELALVRLCDELEAGRLRGIKLDIHQPHGRTE